MATILIVDDEEPIRGFLRMFLEDDGHRVLQAINGAQALVVLGRHRPDLVIADIMMPVVNGAQLCRRLKGTAETQAIPVILMSAVGERVATGAGADAFIAKPFILDDMEALIQRWLPVGKPDPDSSRAHEPA